MADIEYKKASKADARAIAGLAVQMWTGHTVKELTEVFLALIDAPESVVWLLNIDGEAAGFAQCGLRHDYVEGTSGGPVAYLEGIFVKEEYRNKGFARELLKLCEAWAKELGCAEFASDCELGNEVSRRFHTSLGFSEANRIICFVKEI